MDSVIGSELSYRFPHFTAVAPPLKTADAARLSRLLDDVCRQFPDAQAAAFLEAAPLLATKMPYALREFVHDARQHGNGVIAFCAAPFIGTVSARTPSDWKEVKFPSPTHRADVLLVLVASLLGDAFGWATQQNGRYVHDVLPMRGLENEQIGWSSTTPLTWHTEDAFHPHRADYLGLLCIHNPKRVATTVCHVRDLQLSDWEREILSQPRFRIMPDDSHRPKYNTTDAAAFRRIQRMFDDPKRVSVLFGQPADPYLPIDPDYMMPLDDDADAARAFRAVARQIETQLQDLVLGPGDLALLDNYRVVHGRRSFTASYDGTDRWLKRVSIKHDLRKAAEALLPGTRLMT